MKRAAIYARVSTDEQADKGYSLPSQLKECGRFAETYSLTPVAEIKDDISGVAEMGERPGGSKLLEMIQRREIEAVVIHHIDRLSRDIIGLLQTCRDWLRAGIEIYACDIGQIKSELDITLVIKGWQGSDERNRIAERTTRGRREKARSGKVVGNGYAPFGYRFEGGQLVIDEAEAALVRLIFTWYTNGDEDGPMSLQGIAFRLSEGRIPTPGERRNRPRVRASGMWEITTVSRIVQSKTYIGEWEYSGITVPVPAIVDLETWQTAQKRREINTQFALRNATPGRYLLRGMVTCGCGKPMHGSNTGPRGCIVYRCSCRNHIFTRLGERICFERDANKDKLDTLVWEYILDLITVRDRFEQALLGAQEAERNAMQPKRERLTMVRDLIDQYEREARKLLPKLDEFPEGSLMRKTITGEVEKLEAQYTAYVQERDKLIRELETGQVTNEDIAAALEFREAVLLGMQNPTFEDKRMTLEGLRVSVEIRDHQAKVTCLIPVVEGKNTIDLHAS